MAKLIECIPNFSVSKEREPEKYQALVDLAQSMPGCTLFDAQTDGNHNRSVFTLIGSPEGIENAAFELTKKAAELIDMSVYMEDVSNRNVKLEAIGCMKDFVDMSERVLHKAAEIEATGREIDTLKRLVDEVRKEIPSDGE